MPTTLPIAAPGIAVGSTATGIQNKILAVIGNRDLIAIALFSTAGLLLTVYCVLRLPNLGLLIEQYNQF